MTLIADPLVDRIPFNSFFLKKLVAYRTTELIICSMVIGYNGTQPSCNPVVLKHQKESIPLLIPAIGGYYTEAEKSVYKLFLAVGKMAANYKKKVIIQRGLDINREINTYQCRLQPLLYNILL